MIRIEELLNRDIVCECGRTHRCDIDTLAIGAGVLDRLPAAVASYGHIVLVADTNTFATCGERVRELLGERAESVIVFETETLLVPDEAAVARLEAGLSSNTDLLLGIGSGVLNDLCKYVSFSHGMACGIVATATSMDGYASSGAAMIFSGMKITYTTHAPAIIIGDTDVLCQAPMDMIRAGYADIIGKYSALCDWKLSHLVNGEYLCPFVYRLVMDQTNEIRALAGAIADREPEAIGRLMETLVLIGACLTLLATTRPGSGSEHHLSHFYEIVGLIENKPYFLHGTDVGYATVVTCALREQIAGVAEPCFVRSSREERIRSYRDVFGVYWQEVTTIQDKAGWYDMDWESVYRPIWPEIHKALSECPTAEEVRHMLLEVGFDLSAFEAMYGKEKIHNSILFGKDLKDRYSVLWLYASLGLTPIDDMWRVKHEI